jgi:hypothetical protein
MRLEDFSHYLERDEKTIGLGRDIRDTRINFSALMMCIFQQITDRFSDSAIPKQDDFCGVCRRLVIP